MPPSTDPEAALEPLRKVYREAMERGSPSTNAFANLAWVLSAQTDLSMRDRAESVARWLESAELDRWRAPIQSSQAGENTQMRYDGRSSVARKIRAAAVRFVDAVEKARATDGEAPSSDDR